MAKKLYGAEEEAAARGADKYIKTENAKIRAEKAAKKKK